MGSSIAIGLIILFFILSLFTKRLMSWRILPILYAACIVYFIYAAISGATRLYISIVFIIIGIYGIMRSLRESRAKHAQALDRSDS
jgi:uncharacterized membrane protein